MHQRKKHHLVCLPLHQGVVTFVNSCFPLQNKMKKKHLGRIKTKHLNILEQMFQLLDQWAGRVMKGQFESHPSSQ